MKKQVEKFSVETLVKDEIIIITQDYTTVRFNPETCRILVKWLQEACQEFPTIEEGYFKNTADEGPDGPIPLDAQ